MASKAQPKYDEAWKVLVNAKVLTKFGIEEQEHIGRVETVFLHHIKASRAKAETRAAEAAGRALMKLWGKDVTRTAVGCHLQNKLISEFEGTARDYHEVKDKEARSSIGARWILKQIPLIEAELNESHATETSSGAVHDTQQHICNENDKATQIHNIKQQRRDVGMVGSPSDLQITSSPRDSIRGAVAMRTTSNAGSGYQEAGMGLW